MFYKRIRDTREDLDITQSEVARYLGTTTQYYGKYEKGERELPFSRAILIADLFDVTLDYLAGRTNVQAIGCSTLSDDEKNILTLYKNLTERNKGKAELFIEQLADSQKSK